MRELIEVDCLAFGDHLVQKGLGEFHILNSEGASWFVYIANGVDEAKMVVTKWREEEERIKYFILKEEEEEEELTIGELYKLCHEMRKMIDRILKEDK